LLQHLFDNQGLHLENNTYQVNSELTLTFNKLIFCEGFYGRNNPYFSWLPFNPVKGEVLRVKFKEDISLKEMVNQGVFVIPLPNGRARVGATYSWHDLDWIPTEKGRADLLEKYNKLMLADIEVEEQLAGVRPATKDRRPIVGLHPVHTNLGVFNGLGSKGVSLAPYFAEQFVDFLVNKKELDPEVNINRFGSLYLGQKQS
jgi:glycine/D-amino acid oxidase-like deaminating enzyme